ncbi:MAG: alpha/beta hydrolase [Amphritea sp.]
MSLYCSQESRQLVLAGYQQQLKRLDFEVSSQSIATRVGITHVSIAGDEKKPPLLLLPGLQTPAPFMLELAAPLVDDFRVYCPDLPGQVGLSCEAVPERQDGYGRWVHELLDQLGLEQVVAVGLSFGGAVLLDAARLQPRRISRASLLVPAGIVFEILRPLKYFLLPWLQHKVSPTDESFQRLMQPLMGDNWPELEVFFQAVFSHVSKISQIPPGPFKAPQLADWQAPVQLVMAQQDVYFSVDKLSAAAAKLLPHLAETRVIEDKHIPSAENRQMLLGEISRFLSVQKTFS